MIGLDKSFYCNYPCYSYGGKQSIFNGGTCVVDAGEIEG